MAYYDIARTKASYDAAIVFRGTFDSGAAIAWATRHIKTTTGLVEGRMEVEGAITCGLPETSGGEAPLPSLTIRLHNHDDAITKYIVGATSTDPAVEFRSDGLLNLKGKFYHAVRDPADGSIYEQVLTPTMTVSGSVEYDGFTATVPMAARADYTNGRSVYGFRVRDLKNSDDGGFASGTIYDADGNSALTHAEFETFMEGVHANLDARVPYLYGPCVVPMIPLEEAGVVTLHLVGVTFIEPTFASTLTSRFFFESYDQPVPFHANLLATEYAGRAQLIKIKRAVTTPDGTTANVWVIAVFLFLHQEGTFYFECHNGIGVHDSPQSLPANLGPAGLIRALVRDHAEAASSAVNSTSFNRASMAVPYSYCGGPYYGDALGPEISDICKAAGLSTWLAKDDTLRIAVDRSFNYADKDTVDAGLQHVTHADIIDGWREIVPWDSPDQLGAPVSRMVLDWTEEQRKFWGGLAPTYGAGATSLPMAEIREGFVPGKWLLPATALEATEGISRRRAFVSRRIECVCRAWLATLEPGTLLYLSHPRGLNNSGDGYSLRLVRLENTEYLPNEDACRCRFEDLGGVASRKHGRLDNISNWVEATPTAGWTLTVNNGSTTVTSSNNIFTQAMADDGCHLWTPGATSRDNQGSRKIATYVSATEITVERQFDTNETITAAGSGWTAAWIIMKTQASEGSAFRPRYIRNCVDTTGVYRDGSTAGFTFSND